MNTSKTFMAFITLFALLPISNALSVSILNTSNSSIDLGHTSKYLTVNYNGTVLSIPLVSNAIGTRIQFWPGTIIFSTTNGFNSSIYADIKNVTEFAPPPPSNYNDQMAMALNVTPSKGVSVYVTLNYNCKIRSNYLQPFILVNGTWKLIPPFTLNTTECSVSFYVPSDPIIALMLLKAPGNGLINVTTTINGTISSTKQLSPENISIMAVVIIVACVIVYLLMRNRRDKLSAAPQPAHPQQQSIPDTPIKQA